MLFDTKISLLQTKKIREFVKCHEQESNAAASFTLEKLSNNISTLYLVVTLSCKEIPNNERLKPCFDLSNAMSRELISTKIPITTNNGSFNGSQNSFSDFPYSYLR